jgi:hypothetical protein
LWGIEIVSTVEKLNHALSIPHTWRIEIQYFVCNMGMPVLHQEEKGIG